MTKAKAQALRNTLRTLGNQLSLEGHTVSAGLILKLSSFADDQSLLRLLKEIQELADVNGF